VRPLYDDGSTAPQQATRDYVLKLDAPHGAAALLSIFGGKITTYRRLAETALAMLGASLPSVPGFAPGWTALTALPGGDFPMDGFEQQVAAAAARYPFLAEATLRRLLRAYGTRIDRLLDRATSAGDLGRVFGADLTEAEVRYLVDNEWARTAADVVWRRSKLGLLLSPRQVEAVEEAITGMVGGGVGTG
jgi:glycerol-3-phosphate dehydrogenase